MELLRQREGTVPEALEPLPAHPQPEDVTESGQVATMPAPESAQAS